MRFAVARTPRACEGQAHWSCVPVGFGEGESVRRLCGFFVVLCVLAGWSVPAAAHPHVWIVARSEVVFDAEGKLTGFRHTWTFDPAYSAFAVTGLDSHGDGKPDPDKLAELAKTNVESLEEWGYFTAAKVNGTSVEFARPAEYSQTPTATGCSRGSFSIEAARLAMFLARSPMRSRSAATRMAVTVWRRSTASGWRRAIIRMA